MKTAASAEEKIKSDLGNEKRQFHWQAYKHLGVAPGKDMLFFS
jgi:hypothetical protein